MKKALVIGNGRSLYGYDFTKIDRNKYDIYGNTLAFRHWYEIDWFPDVYINVDEVVCSDNKEVADFIRKDKCKQYLVSRSILKNNPDLHSDKIIYIEDMLNRGKKLFQYIKTWCSGSAGVALALGSHSHVDMIGFDCDYVEFIPECECHPDGSLIITETPTHNPNYFIDSYQRKGDKYNVPNCKSVHLKSWEELSYIVEFINKMFPSEKRTLNNYNDKKSVSKFIITKKLELFLNPVKKQKVAFCVPSTTNKRDWNCIRDTYLFQILLPSITKLTNDYDVSVYVGYDHDDRLYSNVSLPLMYDDINIIWNTYDGYKGDPCGIWSDLSMNAITDGFDYFMCCGDDIVFDKNIGWMGRFIKALKKNNNVGYSAGWSNNDAIPTQFLFHKTHFEIFGWVFPPQIKNYYCDDFIYELYGKYGNWMKEYKHLNIGGEPRYVPNDDKNLKTMLVKRHKPTMIRYACLRGS